MFQSFALVLKLDQICDWAHGTLFTNFCKCTGKVEQLLRRVKALSCYHSLEFCIQKSWPDLAFLIHLGT